MRYIMNKFLKIIPITVVVFACVSCIDFWSPAKFNDGTMQHTSSGNFIYKSGGHLQSNLNLLDKLHVKYEITKTFDNGVRVGKIKTADNPDNNEYYYKTNHAWFPKHWNKITLRNAVRHIVNEPSNKELIKNNSDGETVRLNGEYKNVRIVVIVKMLSDEVGKPPRNVVITAYPDSKSQPEIDK